MAEGYIGVPDQSTFGLSSGTGVKVIDTNEITLVNTTSANPVTSDGLNTITPAAMTNIAVGVPLIIDNITSGVQETVVVVATTGSTFSAYFRNLHTSGFSIVLNVERQNFSISDPVNLGNVATVSGSALNVNHAGGMGSTAGNPLYESVVNTVGVSGNVGINGVVPVSGSVSIGTALPAGSNIIGTVNINGFSADAYGGLKVGIDPGTNTIGNVNINGVVPVSGTIAVSGFNTNSAGQLQVASGISGANVTGTISQIGTANAITANVSNAGRVVIEVNSSNYTQAFAFQGSLDSGSTWFNISGARLDGSNSEYQTPTMTNQTMAWAFDALNLTNIRIYATLVSSGTANVIITQETLDSVPNPVVNLASGTNTIGNVGINGTIPVSASTALPVSGTISIGTSLPSGSNYLGSVSISGIAAVSGALSTSTQDLRTSGVMSATTLNSSVSATLGSGQATMAIEILNNTTGATLSFQGTNEGAIWFNINVVQAQTNLVVSTTNSANFFGKANVAGLYAFRVIVTTVSTASTIVAYLYASTASQVHVLESLPAGTNQIGTVGLVSSTANIGSVKLLDTGGSNVASINGNGALSIISYNDATNTSTVPASTATNTVVKAASGRLVNIVVTAQGTTDTLIYDNATTNSGTVIGLVPAYAPTGYTAFFDMPAASGITVGTNATRAGFTVGYR